MNTFLPPQRKVPAAQMKKIYDTVRALHCEAPKEFLPLCIAGQKIGFLHGAHAAYISHLDKRIQVGRDAIHIKMEGGNGAALTSFFKEINEHLVSAKVLEVLHGSEMASVGQENSHAPLFQMYRYAFSFWGIPLLAVHLNGWQKKGEARYMWAARRSLEAKVHPGTLDHLVCGAVVHGLGVAENLYKEAKEEAGMARALSSQAHPVGLVSCALVEHRSFKRFVPFMYDLQLPTSFRPANEDGALSEFFLLRVASFLEAPELLAQFKPTCRLVIVSFLIRHGYLTPDAPYYIPIVQCLSRAL